LAIDISKLNHEQLTVLAARVQGRIAELQIEKVAKVRDKVMAMITSEGIDYAELMGHAPTRKRGKAKVKVKQKYRNPANKSETWSGRGRQPGWFAAAIKAGKKESALLIK
jgi:DNA-binding protein H-NS